MIGLLRKRALRFGEWERADYARLARRCRACGLNPSSPWRFVKSAALASTGAVAAASAKVAAVRMMIFFMIRLIIGDSCNSIWQRGRERRLRIPTKSPGHSEMMSPGVPT
jgi:hypothetical protein